jgi:tetratricopeptide (TPR) repeat protein
MNQMKALKLALCLVAGALWQLACGAKPAAAPGVSPNVAQPANSAPASNTAGPLAEAEKLYAGRGEDLSKVRAAIATLRSAQAADGANYDVNWRLAKYHYYLGDNATDEDESSRAFDEGVKAGEQAVKIQPEKPEGHFWLGACYGGQARHSLLQGATSVDDIRREMNKVVSLDEGFQGGAAYLALGQIEMELPAMMGGSPKKAIEYLEKGQKFSTTNALTRFWLAKAYLATGRKPEAKAKLDEVLKMTPDPDYLPEHTKVVKDAQKLLQDEFGGK